MQDCVQEPNELTAVLGSLRKKGVQLWPENGQLRFLAPRGAMTATDLAGIRRLKHEILTLLEQSASMAVPPAQQTQRRHTPFQLTYSQLSHWHLYGLGKRRHVRQIASATRLTGMVNLAILRNSLNTVAQRHDALRIKIWLRDDVPVQAISEARSYALAADDLSHLSESCHDQAVQEILEKQVLEPIDVTADPPIAARIIRLRRDAHVLILALEHLIADGISMSILLRDLHSTYGALSTGTPVRLPPVAVQFSDYAIWQRTIQESIIKENARYWKAHLAGAGRVSFPEDALLGSAERPGWGFAPIDIDERLTSDLKLWCRRTRSTLVMSVLTAYVCLLARWCKVDDIVIRYVFDGRATPGLENTIGYFAFMLFLRVHVAPQDTFTDVLGKLMDEYCRAQEHPTFGCIESEVPLPAFARNAGFNWLPQEGDGARCEPYVSYGSTGFAPISFDHPLIKHLERDSEPFVQFYQRGEHIAGGAFFPLRRFSFHTMQKFSASLLRLIEWQLERPGTIVSAAPLP